MEQESICIEDFCGYSNPGHFPTTFSADWFPAESLTHFTGEWCDCPPMPSATQPTEEDVWNWARKHSAYFATA
jgi:hypothetical protein